MNPFEQDVASALTYRFALALEQRPTNEVATTHHGAAQAALPNWCAIVAPYVTAAMMKSYWRGWDDGHAERGADRPGGASGRGIGAALAALRGAQP